MLYKLFVFSTSSIFICSATFLFFGVFSVFAQTPVQFTRNLSIGDTGQDVLELQKILNTNTQTQVATFGAGSSGNETTYFGSLTRDAVIRYQNLYAQDILVPVGLSSGTGFVGFSTRAKLNTTLGTKTDTTTVSQSVPSSRDLFFQPPETRSGNSSSFLSDLAGSRDLLLFYPSAYTGSSGISLTLNGAGFEDTNTVHFGKNTIKGLASRNSGTTITLEVPALSTGRYDIEVENSKGKTNTDSFFVITDSTTQAPEIISVSPAKGSYGESVTITGTGFTKENNEIRTSYGLVQNLKSSDGRTLSFNIEPYPEQMSGGRHSSVESFDWDISLTVLNDKGISNRSVFTLEF